MMYLYDSLLFWSSYNQYLHLLNIYGGIFLIILFYSKLKEIK